MNEDDFDRAFLMSTAAKSFRGEPLTAAEREGYNGMIRLGARPVPTVVQCSKHSGGANILYGRDDQPEGSIRRTASGEFECAECGDGRHVSVRPIPSI